MLIASSFAPQSLCIVPTMFYASVSAMVPANVDLICMHPKKRSDRIFVVLEPLLNSISAGGGVSLDT